MCCVVSEWMNKWERECVCVCERLTFPNSVYHCIPQAYIGRHCDRVVNKYHTTTSNLKLTLIL